MNDEDKIYSGESGHQIEIGWLKSLEGLDKSPFLHQKEGKGHAFERTATECLTQGIHITKSRKHTQRWVKGLTGDIPLLRMENIASKNAQNGASISKLAQLPLPRVERAHSAPPSPETRSPRNGIPGRVSESSAVIDKQPHYHSRHMSFEAREGPVSSTSLDRPTTANNRLMPLDPLVSKAKQLLEEEDLTSCYDGKSGIPSPKQQQLDPIIPVASGKSCGSTLNPRMRDWALDQCRLQTQAANRGLLSRRSRKQEKEALRRKGRGSAGNRILNCAATAPASPRSFSAFSSSSTGPSDKQNCKWKNKAPMVRSMPASRRTSLGFLGGSTAASGKDTDSLISSLGPPLVHSLQGNGDGSIAMSLDDGSLEASSLASSYDFNGNASYSGAQASICPSLNSMLYFPTNDPEYRKRKWMAKIFAAIATRRFAYFIWKARQDSSSFRSSVSNQKRLAYLSGEHTTAAPRRTSVRAILNSSFRNQNGRKEVVSSKCKETRSMDASFHLTDLVQMVKINEEASSSIQNSEEEGSHLEKKPPPSLGQLPVNMIGTVSAGLRSERQLKALQTKALKDKLRYAALKEKMDIKHSKYRMTPQQLERLRRVKAILTYTSLAARIHVLLKYQLNPKWKAYNKIYQVKSFEQHMKAASVLRGMFARNHFTDNAFSIMSKIHHGVLPEHVKRLGKEWAAGFKERRRHRSANLLRIFLQRVSFGHQISFLVGKLLHQVRALQRMVRGYQRCNEARLRLLSRLWAREEREQTRLVQAQFRRDQDALRRRQIDALTDPDGDKWLPTKAMEMEHIRKFGEQQFRRAQHILDEMAGRDKKFKRQAELSRRLAEDPHSAVAVRARRRREERKRLQRRAVVMALSPEKVTQVEEFLRTERRRYLERVVALKAEHDRARPPAASREGRTVDYLERCLRGFALEQMGLGAVPDRPHFCVLSGAARGRFRALVREACERQVLAARQQKSELLQIDHQNLEQRYKQSMAKHHMKS